MSSTERVMSEEEFNEWFGAGARVRGTCEKPTMFDNVRGLIIDLRHLFGMLSLFKVLGVESPSSGQGQITASESITTEGSSAVVRKYRRYALLCHPDKRMK